jgi:predicted naringenin-chalcone synthase
VQNQTITRIVPYRDFYKLTQKESVAWLLAAVEALPANAAVRDKKRTTDYYKRFADLSRIQNRNSCVSDYTHDDFARYLLYQGTDEQPWYAPSIKRRMDVYAKESFKAADRLFPSDAAYDCVVDVSCTGYAAPNTMQRVCAKRGWNGTRQVRLGQMGCYASLPALNLAARLSLDTTNPVALFLCELCTLHLSLEATAIDEIVGNSLFSDGAVFMEVRNAETSGLRILGYHEEIIPGTVEEMTWIIAETHFQLSLSKEIPVHIARNIGASVDRFLKSLGLSRTNIRHYAVHPGGPKIIECVGKSLELTYDQLKYSYKVFEDNGNMSSCTLPYVWDEMLRAPEVANGDHILSVSFGPGLTLVMNVLQRV